MSETLLSALSRRFSALAEVLPGALPAIESDDPVAFILRYRRDALAGLDDAAFVRLRSAARDVRELERRRRAARKAQQNAGTLVPALLRRIDESRDPVWLEDLARPAHRSRPEAEDPMTPIAREVLAAGRASSPDSADAGAASATPPAESSPPVEGSSAATAPRDPAHADESSVAAETDAPQTAGSETAVPGTAASTDASSPDGSAGTTASAESMAAPDPSSSVETSAPAAPASAAPRSLDDLLAPFCGPDGSHPTAVDQRARLVRLVAGLLGDDADLRLAVRKAARAHGRVKVDVLPAHAEAADWKVFRDFDLPANEIPARRLLLLRRGQRMGALKVRIDLGDEPRASLLSGPLAPAASHPYADVVADAAREALDRVLLPAAASEILKDRRRQAERSMLPRIADALRERLLSPPAGAVAVVAVVPGAVGTARIVVVDATGRSSSTVAVHPFGNREGSDEQKAAAAAALLDAVRGTETRLVAVCGSRRARAVRDWTAEVLGAHPDVDARPVSVNEAAAARWADSDEAKADAPDLPASARVGLSIARLLQDPLVEASRWDLTEVPLDPNQRDLDQGELRRALDEVASDCAAWVGVDVNTAPASLLARVPGLDAASAKAIVDARTKNGPFPLRADVRRVEGLTEVAWQRAGGFLRVRGGADPIDATGVHPTGLPVVAAVAAKLAVEPRALVGAKELLEPLSPADFATEAHRVGDVESVLRELAHGAADPRTPFVAPAFNVGVERLRDVQPGMELTGVVASVSRFGAFVDVGVRQSGLVHVSEMAHAFVDDPAQVVKPGQSVRVKVLSVDPAKRRISLSMKALLPAPERPAREERPRRDGAAGAGAPEGGDRAGARSGGFRGPPRRDGPGGPGAPGGGPRGRRDGPRDAAPRAPLGPERPGTPPRRAAGRFRGRDAGRRDDDLAGRGTRRDDPRRGGGAREREEEVEERPAKRSDAPRALDPFLAQLAALSGQLGLPSPVARPAAAPAAPAEESVSGKERRAQRRAAARAAALAAGTPVAEETGASGGPSGPEGDGPGTAPQAADDGSSADGGGGAGASSAASPA